MSKYKIIFIGKKKKGSPVGTGVETSQIQAAILHSGMTVKGMLMNEDCLNKYSKKKTLENSFLWKGTGTFPSNNLCDFRKITHMSRGCTFCKRLLDMAVIRGFQADLSKQFCHHAAFQS